jgi:hypothetical protein
MAKLMWVTNTTTWYEFELTPEEYESYVEDPDTFMENNDVFGEATIVREKVIEPDDIELIEDDQEDDDFDDYDEEDRLEASKNVEEYFANYGEGREEKEDINVVVESEGTVETKVELEDDEDFEKL